MGSNLGLTRLYGRAEPGQRVLDQVPGDRGGNVSTIGAIGLDGIRTGLSVPGAIDGETMLFFVEELLVPTLKRDDIVVMDNNPIHKLDDIEDAIEGVGRLGPVSSNVLAGSEPDRKLLVESEIPPAVAQAAHVAGLTRCVSRSVFIYHPTRHSGLVSALWLSGRIHLKIAIRRRDLPRK